jgi:hypothetical protein
MSIFDGIRESDAGQYFKENISPTLDKVGSFMIPTDAEGNKNYDIPALLANYGNALRQTRYVSPSGQVTTVNDPLAGATATLAGGLQQANAVKVADLKRQVQMRDLVTALRNPNTPQQTQPGQNHVPDEAPIAPTAPQAPSTVEATAPAEGTVQKDPMLAAIEKSQKGAHEAAVLYGQTPAGVASPMFAEKPGLAPTPSFPKGSTNQEATNVGPTAAVAPNERALIENIVNTMTNGGSTMPDPMAMATVYQAFGPEVALKTYDVLHNAKLADTGTMNAVSTILAHQNDARYKTAQIADLEAKRDPTRLGQIAGAEQKAKTEAEMAGKRDDRQLTINAYKASPISKARVSANLAKLVPGAKTMGDVMDTVGPEGLEKILGHISTMEAADKTAAGALGSADLARLGATAQGYITILGDVNRDIAKAEGNYQIAIVGTDSEKKEYAAYKDGLYKMRDDIKGKLEPIQGTLTDIGNQAAKKKGVSTRRRPEAGKKVAAPESAKASEASAYGVPPTIPKGTGIPQEYKGKTIYILKGAAYDADGNFISIITDKRKKR